MKMFSLYNFTGSILEKEYYNCDGFTVQDCLAIVHEATYRLGYKFVYNPIKNEIRLKNVNDYDSLASDSSF